MPFGAHMGPNGVPRVSGMWPKAWDRLRQGLRRPLEGPNRAPGSIEKRCYHQKMSPARKGSKTWVLKDFWL